MDPTTVAQLADRVQQLDGTGEVLSLSWHAGDMPEERIWLLDLHGAVIAELRRRGVNPQGTVVRDEPGVEHYAIHLAPPRDEPV